MQRRFTLVLLALALSVSWVRAESQRLNTRDIAAIKRACAKLMGAAEYREVDAILQRLTPFLRTPGAMEKRVIDCHSQHCNTSIPLRDDAEVWYLFLHVPSERSIKGLYFDSTPDIEVKGNNRVEAVAFVRHGKLLYSNGDLPEWFADGHLRR